MLTNYYFTNIIYLQLMKIYFKQLNLIYEYKNNYSLIMILFNVSNCIVHVSTYLTNKNLLHNKKRIVF